MSDIHVDQLLAEPVRRIRARTGLSQRAFAVTAGTSGPSVAAYESGAREPRLSTVARLARAAGLAIEVDLRPDDPGGRARARRERRRLALAAAALAAAEGDWPTARAQAEANLARARAAGPSGSAVALLDEWESLLEEGPSAARRAVLAPGDHASDLRQMSPLAGLLTPDARRAALAVADLDR